MDHQFTFPPTEEARRIRWYLRKIPKADLPLRMVVSPREREAILAELTAKERTGVELLTRWTWP